MRRREFVSQRLRCALWRSLPAGPLCASAPAVGRRPWLLVPMDDARPIISRPTASRSGPLERTGQGGMAAQLARRVVPPARDAAAARDAALAGITVEPSTTGAGRRSGPRSRAETWTRCRWRRRRRWRSTRRPTPRPGTTPSRWRSTTPASSSRRSGTRRSLGQRLKKYDWLHLHHEDFTGQYSKFYLNYSGAPWLAEMVERNQRMARQLGLPQRAGPEERRGRAIARLRGERRLPVRHVHRHRNARPGAGERRHRHRGQPTPTARRWIRTPPRR